MRSLPRTIAAGAVTLMVLGAAAYALDPAGSAPNGVPAVLTGAPFAAPIDPVRGVPSFNAIVRDVAPAVVSIASTTRTRPSALENLPQGLPDFRLPPGLFDGRPQAPGSNREQPQSQRQSAGSGVIIDAAKGYVLTNNHVVDSADDISVTLQDKRRFKAELVGKDKDTDIALLKIPAGNLTAVRLGDSSQVQVGDVVVAIGNPFGLGGTVTAGIVSAVGRSGLGIEGYEDFIQTDASINPGNSGGALINMKGELIGINTAIIGPSGGNVGIGFAVPVKMAQGVITQLVEFGEVRRGRLGIEIQDVTPDVAQALGTSATQGVVVTRVEPNSAAAKAGIQVGDVVVAMNNAPVVNGGQLRSMVGLVRSGEQVDLNLVRGAEKVSVKAHIQTDQKQAAAENPAVKKLAGAEFGPVIPGSPHYGKKEGVLVTNVEQNSPAWNAGLRAGDLITGLNRKPIRNLDDLSKATAGGTGAMALNILRDDAAAIVILRA